MTRQSGERKRRGDRRKKAQSGRGTTHGALIRDRIWWAAGPGWRDEKNGTLHIAVVTAVADTPGAAVRRAEATIDELTEVEPGMRAWSALLVTLPVNRQDAERLRTFMRTLAAERPATARIVPVGLGEEEAPRDDESETKPEMELPGLHEPVRKNDLGRLGRDYQVHGQRWAEAPADAADAADAAKSHWQRLRERIHGLLLPWKRRSDKTVTKPGEEAAGSAGTSRPE